MIRVRNGPLHFLSTLALVACLMFTTIAAKCGGPSENQLDQAASNSARIADYVDKAETVVRSLYKDGTITLAEKDFLADKLAKINSSGAAFNGVIRTYELLTPEAAADLQTRFALVSAYFLELIQGGTFGVKDARARDAIKLGLAGLQSAITIISAVINFTKKAHGELSREAYARLLQMYQPDWTRFRNRFLREAADLAH